MAGDEVPIGKRCKQGAPESFALWNILLDNVLAPILRKWQEERIRVPSRTLTADGRNRLPHNWADKVGLVTHLAYAGDIILMAKSLE